MRTTAVMIILLLVTICVSATSASAEWRMQARYDALCQPAKPSGLTIQKWKAPEACANDCFASKLSCSNAKTFQVQSQFNPNASELETRAYSESTWLFPTLLLVLLAFIAGTAFLSGRVAVVVALNMPLVLFVSAVMWALRTHIIGDPFAPSAVLSAFLLNGYADAIVIGLFLLIDLAVWWRWVESLFYHHPREVLLSPITLQPTATWELYEPNASSIPDIRRSSAWYRSEAARWDALREKMDAQTRLMRAYLDQLRAHDDIQRDA